MAVITGVHPNVAAFLDMIAWSEGTDNGRQPTRDRGYDVLVGGELFASYQTHPRKLVRLRPGLCSTAAGRYQLLARYFDYYSALLRLTGFAPIVQDKIALQQIRERGALPVIEKGDFAMAISMVNNIWASLTGAGYGQHEHKLADLQMVFQQKGGVVA
jgi:muramidase (phage lysozyme)